MNTATCDHEDCDCVSCETCGVLVGEDEGETFSGKVGEDYESFTYCRACADRMRAEAECFYVELPGQPVYGDDEIPF